MEGAKIHAENSIRQKNQSLNYRRMSARIDAVAARVQTAITTKQVCLSCLTTSLSFLWPSDRASHYILPLWFLLSFVLFSSPILSGCRLDVFMSTILPHVMLP